MKKYNWFKPEIDKKLSLLKSLPESYQASIAINACEDLVFDLDDFEATRISEKANIPNEFYKEYLVFLKNKCLWNHLINFYIQSNFIDEENDYCDTALSKEDTMTLVHDFFKYATTKEIYKDFLKLSSKKENYDYVYGAPRGFCAESFYLPYYNDFYVQVNPDYGFNDVSSSIHEFGHGIQQMHHYQPVLFSTNYAFIEIISTFFDFLTYDYYSKQNDFKHIAPNKFKNFYNSKIEYAANIVGYIGYLKELDLECLKEKTNVIEAVKNRISKNELYVYGQILKERKISEDIPSLLGTIISIELINIYQKDPEKAFFMIKQIIDIDARVEPKEYFAKIIEIGIIPNASTNIFENNLKRELSKF